MKKIPLIVWVILVNLVFVHYFYMPEKPEIATGGMRTTSTQESASARSREPLGRPDT